MNFSLCALFYMKSKACHKNIFHDCRYFHAFAVVHYFAWNLKFIANILSMIVVSKESGSIFFQTLKEGILTGSLPMKFYVITKLCLSRTVHKNLLIFANMRGFAKLWLVKLTMLGYEKVCQIMIGETDQDHLVHFMKTI